MSDAADITVSVITGVATVAASVVAAAAAVLASRRAKQSRDDTRVIKNEVKNDHKTNLREEQDERHEENARKLDQIIETQAEHGEPRTAGGQRRDTGRAHRAHRKDVAAVPIHAAGPTQKGRHHMSHVAPENDQETTPDLGVVITSPKARGVVYGVYTIGALVVGGVGAYFLGIHQPIPEPVIGAQAVVAYLGIPIGGLAYVNRNR